MLIMWHSADRRPGWVQHGGWRMEGGGFTDSHTEMLSTSRAEIRTNANDSADPSLLSVRISDTVQHHHGWKCTKEWGQILSKLRRHHIEAEANRMTVIDHLVSLIMPPPPSCSSLRLFCKDPTLSTCYFVSHDKWWKKCWDLLYSVEILLYKWKFMHP